MKKKYRVYGKIVGTKYLGVFEAESPEEAAELGLNDGDTYIGLCHQCTKIIQDDLAIEDAIAELAEED